QLNHGKLRHAFPFEPSKCAAPLPRGAGWAVVDADGAVPAAPEIIRELREMPNTIRARLLWQRG
ncbi:hypothetical protein ABTK44_21550, partial [Acinetobacter baumannii]